MLEDIYKDTRNDMESTIESLNNTLATIRTGRASTALLDNIYINYYGTKTQLKNCSTISLPEANLMVIQPWDPSILDQIAKTIQKSDLGLNPTNDGKVLRIVIPPLSEERRKQIVKVVKTEQEASKVGIRNIRRDYISMIKDLEKSKDISEDESKKGQKKIQDITDEFIKKIDDIIKHKTDEILND